MLQLAIQSGGINQAFRAGRDHKRHSLMAKQKSTTRGATRSRSGAAEVLLSASRKSTTIPVWFASSGTLDKDLRALTGAQRNWVETTAWKPDAGSVALLPGSGGELAGAVLGLGDDRNAADPLVAGALPRALPPGAYHFASSIRNPDCAAIAWAMGAYDFARYRSGEALRPRKLKLPAACNEKAVRSVSGAVAMGRDLINTPANDLGPVELAAAAQNLARKHGATFKTITGDALLRQNYPLIHAVGRASDRAPRLIDIRWGPARAPKVTLVGKGVTYDTGGLSLKPTSAMLLMKKDMGGAAAVLTLASMIMDARLKLRLRVLIPAADNNVSANSFRPGDVLASRNGMSVEIGNTDAEGRLVLADALALADEEAPDYLISLATLTGAARVALGPDLPPLYASDDRFADGVLAAGKAVGDPLWRMPFWKPYDVWLKAKTGDVNHISDAPFAGSVTAALFLKRFVTKAERYAHFDIYGWVPRARPGCPEGGEPQAARALFEFFRGLKGDG